MRLYWKTLFLGGIIVFFLIGSIHPVARGDISVGYHIQKLFESSTAQQLAVSGKHLFLRTGDKEIIIFENEQNRTAFHANKPIRAFTAISQHLIISTGSPPVLTIVSVENSSAPTFISSIEIFSERGDYFMGSYDKYVYTTHGEAGFTIYDLSNMSFPHIAGGVTLSHWNIIDMYIVSRYAFFNGNKSIVIFELDSSHPVSASLLWDSVNSDPYQISGRYFLGKPGVSSDNFVFNFRIDSKDSNNNYLFQIIPRTSTQSLGTPYIITYPAGLGYTDCALIDDNILVVAGRNNTVNILKLASGRELHLLSEIFLGSTGSIEELYPINGTNDFYIADGANGLLKLSLTITLEPSPVPGFLPEAVFLMVGCLIRFQKKALYGKKQSFKKFET